MAILQVEDIVRTCARFEQLGAKPVFGTQLLAAAEVGEGGRGERASRYTPGSALPKAPGTVRHVFAATRRGGVVPWQNTSGSPCIKRHTITVPLSASFCTAVFVDMERVGKCAPPPHATLLFKGWHGERAVAPARLRHAA